MCKALSAALMCGGCGYSERACDSWITNSEIKFEDQKTYVFLGWGTKKEMTEGFFMQLLPHMACCFESHCSFYVK